MLCFVLLRRLRFTVCGHTTFQSCHSTASPGALFRGLFNLLSSWVDLGSSVSAFVVSSAVLGGFSFCFLWSLDSFSFRFFFPSVSFIFPLVLSVLVGPKKQVSLVSKSGRLSFLPASHYHLVLPVFPSPTWAKPAPSAATSPPPVLQAFSRSPATVGTLVSSGFLLLLSLFLLLL